MILYQLHRWVEEGRGDAERKRKPIRSEQDWKQALEAIDANKKTAQEAVTQS